MVGARGGAERQREQGASRTHLKEAAGTVALGMGTNPSLVARTLNLLLNGKKESRLEICVFGSGIWSAGEKCWEMQRQTDTHTVLIWDTNPHTPPTLFQAGSASASPTSQRLTGITAEPA